MQLTAYCKGLRLFTRAHTRQLNKMWLIMRLTIVLVMASVLQIRANGYGQSITIEMHHAPLEKVIGEIRKQSGYSFIYVKTTIALAKRVDIDVKGVSLPAVMALIFKDQPLSYRITDKYIMIAPLDEMTAADEGQDGVADDPPGEIHGRVTGEKGEILPGASVTVKGTNKGVVTGPDGTYVLHGLKEGDILVMSFTGYASQEVKVNGDITRRGLYISVSLAPSADPIDEVQIIAYGSTTKRLNLGNVTTVKSADIEKQPIDNFITALNGRVPGLQISLQTNALPGSAPTVRLRGTNSIGAGQSPLYILDGVPIPEGEFAVTFLSSQQSALMNINPAEIESVEVLKDADATSIYGSRGANGVILITTKKGKIGKTGVSVNAYTGAGKVAHFMDFMNVHQYNAMRREALVNDKVTPNTSNAADLLVWDSTKVTDWQKFFIGGTALTQDANVSVNGGNAQTRFVASAGYHNEGTTFPGNSTGANRKSARFTVDHNSTDGKFGLSATTSYSITTLDLLSLDLTQNINMAPDYPLYTPSGAPNWGGVKGFPLGYLLQPYNSKADNYNGHVLFRYTPVKGLNLKLDGGFNNSVLNQRQQMPTASTNPAYGQPATLTVLQRTDKTWIAEPQIDYTLDLSKNHITVLAGGTWQENESVGLQSQGSNFPSDALIGNISSATTITANNYSLPYTYNSFFSRVNYNWDQRYLVNISFRRDGSSRFGPGYRFGNFGSVAAGWIFTQERFVRKALPFLSFGKLRASYGTNGNDQVGDYQYLSSYGSAPLYQTSTLVNTNLGNPDYRWEQDHKFEAGLELGALKDRILFRGSYILNRVNNQLLRSSISPQTGFSSYLVNLPATLQNAGVELELNTKNIMTKDFTWTTSVNFTRIKSKLVRFPGLAALPSYATSYIVGKSLTVAQIFQYQGLDSTGKPKLADLDKDGSITYKDRVVPGSNDPLFGGMSNTLTWKGISLSLLLTYTHINALNNAVPLMRSGAQGTNSTTMVLHRWQHPGDEAHTNTPLFTTFVSTYSAANYQTSTINWISSNIFRLQNLSLSYDVQDDLLKKAKIQKVQVYVLGQNLWVSDPQRKYRLDPETGTSGMPPLRVWTFGLNCTF